MDVALLNDWIQKFNNICFCYEVQGGLDPNIFSLNFVSSMAPLPLNPFRQFAKEEGEGRDTIMEMMVMMINAMRHGWSWNEDNLFTDRDQPLNPTLQWHRYIVQELYLAANIICFDLFWSLEALVKDLFNVIFWQIIYSGINRVCFNQEWQWCPWLQYCF